MLDVMYTVEVLDDSFVGLRAQSGTTTSTITPPALPATSTTPGAATQGFPGSALHDALFRRRTLSEPGLSGVKERCSPEAAGAAKGDCPVPGAAARQVEADRPAGALRPTEHDCSGGKGSSDPLTALAPPLECPLEAGSRGRGKQCPGSTPHSHQLQSGTSHCYSGGFNGTDTAAAAADTASADATAIISLASLHLQHDAQAKTVEATQNLDQQQQQHGQGKEERECAGKDMESSRSWGHGRGERVVVSCGGKGMGPGEGAHEGRYSCWGSVGKARVPKPPQQQQQQKGAGVGLGEPEGRDLALQGGVSLAEQQELQATMLLHYL